MFFASSVTSIVRVASGVCPSPSQGSIKPGRVTLPHVMEHSWRSLGGAVVRAADFNFGKLRAHGRPDSWSWPAWNEFDILLSRLVRGLQTLDVYYRCVH